MSYIPHSEEETKEILSKLGLESLEDLFSHIPKELFAKDFSFPEPKSEEELRRIFERACEDTELPLYFIGAGAYDRIIPSVIWQILSRGEFLTPYTPYQAEASQGTLQAIFEYQSLICELTGMDVANASMYDGASALAEAVLMARAIKGKGDTVVLSKALNPLYRRTVKTYLRGYEDKIVEVPYTEEGTTDLNNLEEVLKESEVHALAVQYPNFFGFVEPLKEIGELCKKYEVPFVVFVDPIALSILKPPAEFGADIVVGEGQQMGIPLSFGGPYVGFFATKKEHVRKMPGRLVGMGEDIEGKRAFTLVLQTREQHIRRERATSNICTNQNLMALANLLYMVLLGKEGMKKVAVQSLSKALYFKKELMKKGFEEVFTGKHLWEFPLRHESLKAIYRKLLKEKIVLGLPLDRFYEDLKNTTLIAVTEKRTKEEIDSVLALL
ncbi:aminomethyl-transferring glycine dehydrogenase subunit GcvPA [Aquifex aeolicus]|uniref:Probable glycine dehydrogenase (decarboxylating) subunit 1 n=1 Tax=Aquifex aeolicus (strain VF5) TaxID=224324 RepID=GCSPA_AQUAE|nr:aminomethyl-transferring glycine dehydrogenase subunit GcvPA [Aquifex aeolicus]O67193.1 RecName: Full=Probable glycine dehydrogenase (decarboxylating) subunit 1; AltName: Full=Glycine cleavage system P-protein subunit 1; AltName: Full=Glycine decarboxylase subunit 1; AltName: Full=Glycine dehydrogenase (aminomethyl-transferring) subunit 1 [Aquifex aeolicus VF5]AAC07143.1 glycine dehydrogenase (decarboxylating) [Aquifex aeolicus VF5]